MLELFNCHQGMEIISSPKHSFRPWYSHSHHWVTVVLPGGKAAMAWR